MQDKKKKSLGRDVFENEPEKGRSGTLKKILEGKRFRERATAKEVELKVKLTPSNIKHLESIRAELEKAGKGHFSRSEMIRVAIALLTAEDF